MVSPALDKKGLKLSKYILTTPLPNGYLRVLSTFWKSIVDLDNRYVDILFGTARSLTEEEDANIRELIELGILLDKDVDEAKLYLEKREEWRTPQELSITLCTTLSCNFQCVYCVQRGNFDKPTIMSSETLRYVVIWCTKLLEKKNCRKLEICFFGGEPLLNYEIIVHAMVEFNRFLKENKLDLLYYQLVTNGSLLSASKIKVLKALGLQQVQFTIDGTPYTHNSRRVGKQGSFGKIWENVLHAAEEGLQITLNCVVDSENYHEIKELIDIAEDFSKSCPQLKRNTQILFSLLIPTSYTIKRCKEVLFGKEHEILSAIIDGYVYAKQLGWGITNWLLYTSSARESKSSYIIGPEGDVYKCYGAIGNQRYCIGSIVDDLDKVETKALSFTELQPWDEECLQCNIFPICRGGCQHISSLYHDGEYGYKLCEKHLWEPALKKALALSILD